MAAKVADEVSNLAGAVVFVIYVIAALFLTAFLSSSLFATYVSLDSTYKRLIDKKLRPMAILSCISFSVLSFNMLNYLIVSYAALTHSRTISLPAGWYDLLKSVIYPDRAPRVHIWEWLKTSTLFRHFAQTICMPDGAFWWTGQALVTTMAWSIYMSVEGKRLGIPHLWAFALSCQILPVSFAMNLFFVAILVYHPIDPGSGWLVEFKSSTHFAGDSKRSKTLDNVSSSPEAESQKVTNFAHESIRIPCNSTNGVADLALEDMTVLPHFYPGFVSVPKLEKSGYSFKRAIRGMQITNKDTMVTASMHPAGVYIIDTATTVCKDPRRSPFPRILVSGTVLFALALHAVPIFSQIQSTIFVPTVLTIRLLIFLPVMLAYTSSSSTFQGSQSWPSLAQHAAYQSYTILSFSLMLEATRLASLARQETSTPLYAILQTINDDPSISALGYDLILTWLSAFLWGVEEFSIAGVVAAGSRAILQAIQTAQDAARWT